MDSASIAGSQTTVPVNEVSATGNVNDQAAIVAFEKDEAILIEIHQAELAIMGQRLGKLVGSSPSAEAGVKNLEITTEAPKEKAFPFMKLPPELRIMILKKLLVKPGSVLPARHCVNHENASQLFATSRLVYRESVPIYFGLNTFYFYNVSRLYEFLKAIGPNYRREIKSIELEYSGRGPARAAKMLAQCIGLRHLTLRLGYGSLSFMRRHVLMEIHGLKDLRTIRGLTTIKVEVDMSLVQSAWPGISLDDVSAFEEALQVLKQPRRAAQLTRQNKKDYPEYAYIRTMAAKEAI